MKKDADKFCKRCGACCKTYLFAYITKSDIEKWEENGHEDILDLIENAKPVWAGDRLVSSKTGRSLRACPFFDWEDKYGRCNIYDARPGVCRDYKAGENEMCPQFFQKDSE